MKIIQSTIAFSISCILTSTQVEAFGDHNQRVVTSSGACSSEAYTLSVSLKGDNVLLTAEPTCGKICHQDCPTLAFHDDGVEERTTGGESSSQDLPLGDFPLGSLVEAYHEASVGTAGHKDGLFRNDCASFLTTVGRKLGLTPSNMGVVKYCYRDTFINTYYSYI